MTRKFHTEKHLKKRQQRLIGERLLKPQEKMAAPKETLASSTVETEATKKLSQNNTPVLSTQAIALPVMAERREIKLENKNWRDQLIEKGRKLADSVCHFSKQLFSHF